eukprot:TRINITY_DN1133_c1_g1_i1.p1 TRINITY_DN1133_c1_g1~~TRINITY_DN1133_c1_g1_i1.p1  ORF type:complete len:694 (-),score=143.94 TRINITY_DN1133_c1_g1_i1:261-2342(-)
MEHNDIYAASNPFGGPGPSFSGSASRPGLGVAQPINSLFLGPNTLQPPSRSIIGVPTPISTIKKGYDLFDDGSDEDDIISFVPPHSNPFPGPFMDTHMHVSTEKFRAASPAPPLMTQRTPPTQNQTFLSMPSQTSRIEAPMPETSEMYIRNSGNDDRIDDEEDVDKYDHGMELTSPQREADPEEPADEPEPDPEDDDEYIDRQQPSSSSSKPASNKKHTQSEPPPSGPIQLDESSENVQNARRTIELLKKTLPFLVRRAGIDEDFFFLSDATIAPVWSPTGTLLIGFEFVHHGSTYTLGELKKVFRRKGIDTSQWGMSFFDAYGIQNGKLGWHRLPGIFSGTVRSGTAVYDPGTFLPLALRGLSALERENLEKSTSGSALFRRLRDPIDAAKLEPSKCECILNLLHNERIIKAQLPFLIRVKLSVMAIVFHVELDWRTAKLCYGVEKDGETFWSMTEIRRIASSKSSTCFIFTADPVHNDQTVREKGNLILGQKTVMGLERLPEKLEIRLPPDGIDDEIEERLEYYRERKGQFKQQQQQKQQKQQQQQGQQQKQQQQQQQQQQKQKQQQQQKNSSLGGGPAVKRIQPKRQKVITLESDSYEHSEEDHGEKAKDESDKEEAPHQEREAAPARPAKKGNSKKRKAPSEAAEPKTAKRQKTAAAEETARKPQTRRQSHAEEEEVEDVMRNRMGGRY